VAQDARPAVLPAWELGLGPERGVPQVVVAQDAQPGLAAALVARSAETPADQRDALWGPADCLAVHSGASLGDPQDDSVAAACWAESLGDPQDGPQDDYLAVCLADDHC
jgi:hypothetical protein